MIKIAVILGSTKPGRNGEAVAKWFYELAKKRTDAEFELVDVADYNLPLYDEPYPAMMQQYTKEHTKKWSQKINEFDGYIFVTAEYNHSIPGALKNAIDFLNVEWKNKAAGFVSYGSAGGARAVEHLRAVAGELHMADVRAQVMLNLFTDFVNMSEFKPDPRHEGEVDELLNQVISWSKAMKTIR
ncbi:MAG TPA: NADPH-dependent FMN reductase [Clostridiales bacterium]|nr:NADPH-dependent FMN reductase [Clostridiales bacterium]